MNVSYFVYRVGRVNNNIQSTLVISTSVISNNRLSRRKKSGPCYNTEI